jgi:hypothetical protein
MKNLLMKICASHIIKILNLIKIENIDEFY